MTQVEDRVEMIPIHNIKPSEIALRAVDKNSEDYLELVDSIRSKGILNPVLVSDHGEGIFGLIDGLHRFTAARDAGLQKIPALVKSLKDSEMMEAQIIANIHKIETKPMDYTRQLFRLLAADPMLTMSDLAGKLSVTTSWLHDRLSLVNLTDEIQELVNEDKIKLANAYSLAKLPAEEQAEYVDRAMTDPPTLFVPLVSQRIKQIKDANKKGREAAPAQFEPIVRVQSKATIQQERETFRAAASVLKSVNAQTAEEGWRAALDWVVSLDPASVEEQRQRYEQRKAQRAEAIAKAKEERQKKKEEEAARQAADITKL